MGNGAPFPPEVGGGEDDEWTLGRSRIGVGFLANVKKMHKVVYYTRLILRQDHPAQDAQRTEHQCRHNTHTRATHDAQIRNLYHMLYISAKLPYGM